MPTSSSPALRPPVGAGEVAPDDRAWFLKDSGWEDPTWVFAPTNALEERHPVRLRWDFVLRDERRFTDDRYAPLLQAGKQLISLIRSRSLCTGLPLRPSSVLNYFLTLRFLVRWMDQEGLVRFSDLDGPALLQFQRWLAELPMARRSTRSASTMQRHLYLFTYLYRFRGELDDALQIDPFPGGSHRQAAGDHEALRRPWPYTPDPVAVALLQAAVDIVTQDASQILQAREIYRQAAAAAASFEGSAHTGRATRALRRASTAQPGIEPPVPSVAELVLRIDMLYAACYVVLSYLVGPRVSEILHLRAGCVRRDDGGAADAPVTVIVGAIYKRQPGFDGRRHEWVAPPVAVQAVSVLEALSAEHRAISGRHELWLRRRRGNGATEWYHVHPEMLEIASPQRVSTQLRRFGASLGLTHQDRPWKLTTHQGRGRVQTPRTAYGRLTAAVVSR